ncbi:hypothetical protein JKP88DRAFT_245732 [Tribonema minus]|uniref:Uncharacterized protein n=1 Tax=Tribonema minus TaxID=303371 RepID=A0A835YVI4_9STRA|nr:hypothetical protein JKP88DRAFT_245732 [Tribonema minus]
MVMQTRKKARAGSASARVMNQAGRHKCHMHAYADLHLNNSFLPGQIECLTVTSLCPVIRRRTMPHACSLSPSIRFTTNTFAAFREHCCSWRHMETLGDPSERVPTRFVDPRHEDPEGFARLPAVRQWAALHKHVATVMRYFHAPPADRRAQATLDKILQRARETLYELADEDELNDDELEHDLALVTVSNTLRQRAITCDADFRECGLWTGSWAREMVVDGWASWCTRDFTSSCMMLSCITGNDYGLLEVMQTRKKARDGSFSASVMQHAELLQCMVEYLGDDKDLCSEARLSRVACSDKVWSVVLKRFSQEFPLREWEFASIPGFTTDTYAAFREHCCSWHHRENRMDPRERVPARFVDPRHDDPEGFAQLPAVRQWAALHKHVTTVMQYFHAPPADRRAQATVDSIVQCAQEVLYEFAEDDELDDAELEHELALITTSSALRGRAEWCVDQFRDHGLWPLSVARDMVVDGWASWCTGEYASKRLLLCCVSDSDWGI